jgi:hypothetical protein
MPNNLGYFSILHYTKLWLMPFHLFRPSFWPKKNFLNRIWAYHDRNPLPPIINLRIRYLAYLYRKIDIKMKSKRRKYVYGNDGSLKIAPAYDVLKTTENEQYLYKSESERRFKLVHEINEKLYCPNGTWKQNNHTFYYGSGITIEEVALRVRGYISAYKATKNPNYLERAEKGCRYLIDKRIFKDGHIFLQGHTIIDITYAFAGEALLTLWEVTKSGELLDNAKKIGDRLIEYHISGSVNHAIIPVQLLGKLYQITGEYKYLKNCSKRIFRSAIPFQLPYGGWMGHESLIWYHALILRSLIVGYASMPCTMEYFTKKDKIAMSIIAAVNRFINYQLPDGSFPLQPPEPLCQSTDNSRFLKEKARFNECGKFELVNDNSLLYGSWNGDVIDALVTAYELLDIKEVIPCLNKYARNICASNYVWRLEFDTLGAGRLLEYTHVLLQEKKDLGEDSVAFP